MKTKFIFLTAVLLAGIAGTSAVSYVYLIDNVNAAEQTITIKIKDGATYQDVLLLLRKNNALKNFKTFELACRISGYERKVRSGNYVIEKGMNNRTLVNMLKGGLQTPVKLVIYNIRTKEEFAGLVGRTLAIDSHSLLQKLSDPDFCKKLNTDTNNILSRFPVDNYELYWNISEEMFFKKMGKAYIEFWNADRSKRRKEMNYTEAQVTTLASIVEREVIFDKEMPTVAGVYLNRLKIGMPLQADPTLVFATKDFTARRVTNYHKDFESPYNTYKHAGLPPGPICMPKKKAIDAVLNAEKHNYFYFCANPDMSGYSIFSVSYSDQIKVANLYRKKLNAMRIR